MNFWYVNVEGTEPKNDNWDLEQARRLAEREHRPGDFQGKNWSDLTEEVQNEQISETPVPFVQLFGVAPGAWLDPTELLSLPSKKFGREYADLLRGASVSPSIDSNQLDRLARQVQIVAQEMTYGDVVFTQLGDNEFCIGRVVGNYRYLDAEDDAPPHQIPIDWSDNSFTNPETSAALGAAGNSTNEEVRIVPVELEKVKPLLDQAIYYQWAHPRR